MVGGFKTVAYVEFDRYAQGVLMSRMRSGDLDDAPIFEDVRTFDGRRLRRSVDVISGGFPCQDLSVAGKRAGIVEGDKSGLWREYARIVGRIRPWFVLVENVPGLLNGGGLGVVLGDLASMGYDAEWQVLSAAEVGAPHLRERVFIVANSMPTREWRNKREIKIKKDATNSEGGSVQGWDEGSRQMQPGGSHWRINWQEAFSKFHGMDDGMAYRVDRITRAGNGVVPQTAAIAWQKIKDLAGVA